MVKIKELQDLRIKELQGQIADLQKKVVEESKAAFAEVTKWFFDQYPELHSFGWRQYTPYFNDGDTCYFGVYADDLDYNGFSYWDDLKEDQSEDGKLNIIKFIREYDHISEYDEDGKYTGYHKEPRKGYRADLSEMDKQLTSFIQGLPEEFMKSAFGDHAAITVHRGGKVEVDEYDHD